MTYPIQSDPDFAQWVVNNIPAGLLRELEQAYKQPSPITEEEIRRFERHLNLKDNKRWIN